MNDLTIRQSDCLAFIRTYFRFTGFSPTLEEVQRGINSRSSSYTRRMVDGLQECGYLRRSIGRNRSIELIDTDAVSA